MQTKDTNAPKDTTKSGSRISNDKKSERILTNILDEISVRFLLQIDEYELTNIERLFFILEEAHWFYIDNYKNSTIGFVDFCDAIITHNEIHINLLEGLQIFSKYKKSVKVFGCIIFDTKMEHVLVVKENKSPPSYGFPKGKKNMNEEGVSCAIREVYEEIGYDATHKIVNNLCFRLFDKMTFYFVLNVSRKKTFSSQLCNEIKDILWLPIAKIEQNSLGKKFAIVTKSYPIWKDMHTTLVRNRYTFDKTPFVNIAINVVSKAK